MTPEDKQLLLRDLCARLPYGVRYKGDGGWGINPYQHTTSLCTILNSEEPLVYLRPMESMTEEERRYLLEELGFDEDLENGELNDFGSYVYHSVNVLPLFDWLNAHHFDFRGLIEKGLALEAPADMYKS